MSISIGFATTGSSVTHLAEKISKHAEPGIAFSEVRTVELSPLNFTSFF